MSTLVTTVYNKLSNNNMFKVSFFDKKVERFNGGKATVVTLKGDIDFPKQIDCLPDSVYQWMRRYVGNSRSIKYDGGFIKAVGKAICSDSDNCDPVVGERIAEARAKVDLYRFMNLFCKKVFFYYYAVLHGYDDVTINVMNNSDSVFNAAMKYETLHERESRHLNTLLHEQPDGQGTPHP